MTLPRFTTSQIGSTGFDEAWHRDGAVIVEGFWGPEDLARARSQATALRAACAEAAPASIFDAHGQDHGNDAWFRDSGGEIRAFFEPETPPGLVGEARARWVNKLGHALHDRDPVFSALLRSRAVAVLAHALGRPEGRMVQSMLIFKQPEIGGEVRWHQDASYLRSTPQRVAGLWLALEDADRDNGCLWMVPGAHRGPLRERYAVDWSTREGTLVTTDPTPWPEDEAVPLEVPAGSLVVFHDHMPHRSDLNRSARSRVALTLHAHDRSAEWSADNWLQRGELEPFVLGGR